jgi:hypothetical protein
MKRLLRVAFFLAAGLFTAASANATTYYIDFVGGSNSNNGTSKTSPWKHAPGMVGCVATCGTTPRPGDRFIFKGGVTWPNAVFTWVWTWSGTAANRIYIGVDATWFTGASWARPILDSELLVAGTNNTIFSSLGDYVTFDNFELKNFGLKLPDAGGTNTIWGPNNRVGNVISNCYFHNWVEVPNTPAADLITLVGATTQGVENDFTVEDCTFDGFETPLAQADPNCTGACQGSARAINGTVHTIRRNIFRNIANGVVANTRLVHNNLFEKIRDSTASDAHENAFESLGEFGATALIYNNVIRTVKAGVTFWVNPDLNHTTKVFNNVIVDTTAGNVFNVGDNNFGPPIPPKGFAEIYNNTIECGPDSNPTNQCMTLGSASLQLASAIVKNNHCITADSNGCTRVINVGTMVESNNIEQTKAQANAQGYTLANLFTPASVLFARATIGRAQDLSSLNIPQLQQDIRGQQRSPGKWDTGTYQVPQPPGNLRTGN